MRSDLFNFSTGTPGSCSCESPACNDSPSAGHRLMSGESRTFHSDNCAYYSLGGGVESKDGNPCVTWRVDPSSCSAAPGGSTGECSRVSAAACAFNGTVATITATIDRQCDTLPYAGTASGARHGALGSLLNDMLAATPLNQ